jgi:hypothetical protein
MNIVTRMKTTGKGTITSTGGTIYNNMYKTVLKNKIVGDQSRTAQRTDLGMFERSGLWNGAELFTSSFFSFLQ